MEGGSAGEEIALEKGWKVTTLEDQAAALMEVASGTSDAAIIDLLMAGAMIGEGTSYPDLTYTDRLTEEEYGIGCRKGISKEAVEAAIQTVFMDHDLDLNAVKGVYSIDLKRQEAGLLAACAAQDWSAAFYTAEELRAVAGKFTESPFVQEMTGVGNVCERAAMRGAEKLLVKKTAVDGVTVAVAAEHWEVSFG